MYADELALRDRVRDEAGRDPRWPARALWTPSRSRARTPSVPTRGASTPAKKVNGRKRHIVVDTMGLLLAVIITTAAVQDRDGARRVLDRLRFTMPSVALVWADGGYAGQLVIWARNRLRVLVEIVRKPLGIKTFHVLPRRWVVERTFAWMSRCRRLAHDYERLPEHSEAMIKWAMMTCRRYLALTLRSTRWPESGPGRAAQRQNHCRAADTGYA